MNPIRTPFLLTFAALTATLAGQTPSLLATFSQTEQTLSGSGGTVLQALRPNEISYVDYAGSICGGASAEKWLVRTAAHTMAGDENGDGLYWNPTIFQRIDALLAPPQSTAAGPVDQRDVFWSVSQAMGNNVSATPFRPGDVARIVRAPLGDGQVQHFMRQEQFNQALGLPVGFPLDVDAIAFEPNYGVFFSIDQDVPALLACGGAVLVQDGDVLCVPPAALAFTPDLRIAAVMPNSALVVYTEAQMDAFTTNAQVADRFGGCVFTVTDVEALDIDLTGPVTPFPGCTGFALPVPTLLYSTETLTGGAVLTTRAGGQIQNSVCGPIGTPCGAGPTSGVQIGIRPATAVLGAPSFVNALATTRTLVHVLEAQQPVITVPAGGLPAGATAVDYAQPFGLGVVLIEIVPPVVPPSFPAFPFSQLAFPDLYAPSLLSYVPVFGPWGSFPMIPIPAGASGKLLFQNVGIVGTSFELSTPCVIDVQ